MKPGTPVWIISAVLSAAAGMALAQDSATTAPLGRSAPSARAGGATLVGGALPGGAVISARSACLRPEIGDEVLVAAVGADGAFGFGQLRPGHYTLALRSARVGRQTQASSFGERAAASPCDQGETGGERAAASRAVSAMAGGHHGGAASAGYARTKIEGGMPNRISMNVTVGHRMAVAELDGDAITVEVGADGMLTGSVELATPAAAAPAEH